MRDKEVCESFAVAARKVGAVVETVVDPSAAVAYLATRINGTMLLPRSPALERLGFRDRLRMAGVEVVDADFRAHAPGAAAGLTGADFAIAATGTVVLESSQEAVRLASTLPPVHFVLLDPRTIVADSASAVPLLRHFHAQLPQAFLAYITGPSRTADIERVLTIGVHGPKELHVLLLEGVSDEELKP